MSLLRRYSAAFVVATALVLGACGGETAPTAPEGPGEVDLANDPLIFGLNPSSFVFQSLTATAPPDQVLGVNGLVAIGSAAEFGDLSYMPMGPSWADIDFRPAFSLEPLEWRHTVSIDQAAYGTLADGLYLAEVPVIVRAARNTPQMLSLFLCKGTLACLATGADVTGSHGGGDPTWQRGSDIDAPGAYFYDDYYVVVPGNTTVHITMEGNFCAQPFTHQDPYLYAFELDDTFITLNDDGLCGFNSYMPVTNNAAGAKVVRVRTTSFNAGQSGTYRLRVMDSSPFLMAEPPTPTPEQAEQYRLKALTGSY
jgi:hypothetical protein